MARMSSPELRKLLGAVFRGVQIDGGSPQNLRAMSRELNGLSRAAIYDRVGEREDIIENAYRQGRNPHIGEFIRRGQLRASARPAVLVYRVWVHSSEGVRPGRLPVATTATQARFCPGVHVGGRRIVPCSAWDDVLARPAPP